jgi:hypothetical protein
MKNFLNQIKFIISKINVYFRYKKKSISCGIKWILFGKEISNFTYEIKNEKELLHVVQIITGTDYEVLKKLLNEINFEDNEFKNFLSDDFYSNYSKKKIFGRRLLWFLLIRTLKPDLVIESGVDKKLGSAILIYGLFKNYLEGHENSEFIGLDIENKKTSYFNLDNKNFINYKFYYEDTLSFLSKYDKRKKILYISDAAHNYDFENQEYNLIKKNLGAGSIIISDSNTGSLSDFSIQNKKKIVFFHEKVNNFWHNGAITGISYFY